MAVDAFLTFSHNLVLAFGYLGVFVISVIGSAAILFPLPTDIIIFSSATFLNPLLLGVIAGIGSSIGELTSYYLGRFGEKLFDKKLEKKEEFFKARELFSKYGFWIIPIFAFTPLPLDVIGLICGGLNYDVKKFFIGTLIGKIPRTLLLAFAGSYAIPWMLNLIKIFGI